MDPLTILIGIFLFIAIANNKELSGKDATEQNKDIFTLFTVFSIVMLCMGFGYLFLDRFQNPTDYSLLVPTYILMAFFPMFAKGNTRVIARVAQIALFAYIIMGSFM